MPDEIKIAKVIHIYKSKATDEFSNYRPVSLLPSISKQQKREKLYIEGHGLREKNNILNNNQYGFRVKHSTINALTALTMTSDDVNALEKMTQSLAFFWN